MTVVVCHQRLDIDVVVVINGLIDNDGSPPSTFPIDANGVVDCE